MDQQESFDEGLLDSIVELEVAMLLACPHAGGPAACQQQPDAFRLMRWMAHCVHSEATLLSYYNDLQAAVIGERNLMTEKYNLLESLPLTATSPLVDSIADAEDAWLAEASLRYPHALTAFLGQGGRMFREYLACELETLSDETLEHYAQEIAQAQQHNTNLVIERHNLLCKRLGYASLADREAQLAQAAQEAQPDLATVTTH